GADGPEGVSELHRRGGAPIRPACEAGRIRQLNPFHTPGMDTIFALSSGLPPAGIGVIRISGPHAEAAMRALSGRLPEPRRARLVSLRNGAGELLDRALALWFPGPD